MRQTGIECIFGGLAERKEKDLIFSCEATVEGTYSAIMLRLMPPVTAVDRWMVTLWLVIQLRWR